MSFQKQTGGDSEVVRNKAHLVAQHFSQVEGLHFGETFSLVARLEVIMILLTFAGLMPCMRSYKTLRETKFGA
jgi:hypothetical protein